MTDVVALPTWDLCDLYPGAESPELTADLEKSERDAVAFHQQNAGKLLSRGAAGLAEAIVEFEAIDQTLSRLLSYANLVYAADMSCPKAGQFFQTLREQVNQIAASLVFFTLEINQLDEDTLKGWIAKNRILTRYAPWLRDTRIFIPHQLSCEMERLLHEKSVVGQAAWNRLFDETMAALRFPLGGGQLTSTQALDRLSDRDQAVRREAGQVLGENIRVFALITNTLAKDKEIDDKWRNYPRPPSFRNLCNRVEDSVVDTLVGAVKAAYPNLSHRYYALKAKWFGGDRLDYWDRNAPLPDVEERHYSWAAARDIVLGAYQGFSPELAVVARRFFENPWIDAPLRPGKAPGAFAHPTVPSVHPYLLLAYPVNADTHYMLGAPNRRSRVQRRSAPQPRPRSPAMI